jgi:hypothetical protein
LTGGTTLNDDDKGTDTSALMAPFFTAFNIRNDKRITNVCPWDDMSGSNRERAPPCPMSPMTAKLISEVSLQDSRPHIHEQQHLPMLVLIVRQCVGRLVYGMANESFDNPVTRKRTVSARKLGSDHGWKHTQYCVVI